MRHFTHITEIAILSVRTLYEFLAAVKYFRPGEAFGNASKRIDGSHDLGIDFPRKDFVDDPAAVVADLSSFHIDVGIDENSVGALKEEQPVVITIDALPDQTLTGRVDYIAPTATETGGVLLMWKVRRKAYMAAYTTGELSEFDPAQPARFPENPIVVADPPGGIAVLPRPGLAAILRAVSRRLASRAGPRPGSRESSARSR